jgi:hypothetical protein
MEVMGAQLGLWSREDKRGRVGWRWARLARALGKQVRELAGKDGEGRGTTVGGP